jgi:hypothetical protein
VSYILLIMEPPGQRHERGLSDGHAVYDLMLGYAETLKARGVLLQTNSLREDAVRLSVREGRSHVTDGPFTEAKEFVGGFFLLSCATRAEALDFAAQCPAAAWATIEVREIGPCYE